MISKFGGECPACHQPIERGTEIKRWFRRIGSFGPAGHWEDTGKWRHATCSKVELPRPSSRPRYSRAQVLDYDNISEFR